jgi:hypothetical protein
VKQGASTQAPSTLHVPHVLMGMGCAVQALSEAYEKLHKCTLVPRSKKLLSARSSPSRASGSAQKHPWSPGSASAKGHTTTNLHSLR